MDVEQARRGDLTAPRGSRASYNLPIKVVQEVVQAIWAVSLKSLCLQAYWLICSLIPLHNLTAKVVQGLRCSGRRDGLPGARQPAQSGDECADRLLWASIAPRGCAPRSLATTGLGLFTAQSPAQPPGVGCAPRSLAVTGFSAQCTTCTTFLFKKGLGGGGTTARGG